MQNDAITSKYISFSVDVARQATVTKADGFDWDDNYPSVVGNTFENRILTGDLQVFVYDMEGNYFATVQNISYGGLQQDAGIYEFFGVLQSDKINPDLEIDSGTRFMLVVAANCGAVTEKDGSPDLGALTFTNNWNSFPAQNSSIPMWGAKKITINDEPVQDVGDIHLLRALAKVEVLLDDEIKDSYTITAASITKLYTTGYSFPNKWNTVETPTMLHENSFREYGVAEAIVNNKNMMSLQNESSGHLIYIPEIGNSNGDVRINLTVEDKTNNSISYEFSGDQAIRFAEYGVDGFLPANPVYFNIVRNHYYRYTINGVGPKELNVICDVRPYAEVVLRPGFGL